MTLRDGTFVAVKLIKQEALTVGDQYGYHMIYDTIGRFMHEADMCDYIEKLRKTGSLGAYPWIVKCLGRSKVPMPSLIFEYFDSGSVSKWYKTVGSRLYTSGHRLDYLNCVLNMFACVMEAVDICAKHNIIHMDLSLGNIFVKHRRLEPNKRTYDGYIGDWGLACVVDVPELEIRNYPLDPVPHLEGNPFKQTSKLTTAIGVKYMKRAVAIMLVTLLYVPRVPREPRELTVPSIMPMKTLQDVVDLAQSGVFVVHPNHSQNISSLITEIKQALNIQKDVERFTADLLRKAMS